MFARAAASKGFFRLGKAMSPLSISIGRMPPTQSPGEITQELKKEIENKGWDVINTQIKTESQHLMALKKQHDTWSASLNAPLERARRRALQGYSVGGLFAENLTKGLPTREQWKELKERIDWLHFRQLSYQELSKNNGFIPESTSHIRF